MSRGSMATRCAKTVLILLLMPATLMGAVETEAPPSERASTATDQATPIVIDIQTRQFSPDRVVLNAGQRATLVLRNQDSELHAFVPIEFMTGVNLNVSGNGAPEFGPQGFKRVIIPPEGHVEIQFTLHLPGEYTYICDMPGHQMRGTIVVQ